MAKDRLVIQSIETDDGRRCVDIFRRPDGSFGFEEYVREAEDNSGWQPSSHTAALQYETFEAALRDTLNYVPWLRSHRS